MGLKIGLDFGTTYSMLSEKDDASGRIVPCKYNNQDIVEDSLVFISEHESISCGTVARTRAGVRGNFYYGFKMLLNETDPEELKRQHYNADITPSFITETFLKEILTKCMDAHTVDHIERLVVGVPDVWDKHAQRNQIGTPLYQNRNSLLKIIEKLGFVDDVELYSEPELASAYYLDNYNRVAELADYAGHLLLIDYGGGTLDVSVCKFDSDNTGEARIMKTFGEGWNENGKKGDAGLAFMSRVIDIAVEEAELESNDRYKRKALYSLETALVHMDERKKRGMRSVFDNGLIKEVATNSDLCGMLFDDSIEYGDDNLSINYQQLTKAYMEVIDPVLRGILEQAKNWMENNGINWRGEYNNTGFKIQLVGGFSNFYLVQKTVKEVFGKFDDDIRFQGGFSDQNARNYAVSFGAALVANRDVTITRTAQFSLGIFGITGAIDNGQVNRTYTPYFATKVGDEIIPGRIYLVNFPNGEPKTFHGSAIQYFAYQDESSEEPQALEPTDEYREQMAINDQNSPYIFGISFNKSLIITLYKWRVQGDGRSIIAAFNEFNNTERSNRTFGDELLEHPDQYSVTLESSDPLADIFTLTGTFLI